MRLDPARTVAAVISVVLIGATLSPLVRDPKEDGYPLSTYPMFASRRPTELTVDYALGIARSGERTQLEPSLIGSSEVLQAHAILAHAVAHGRSSQTALCRAIAGRVAADPDHDEVVEIQLVTGTHDAVDYLVRKRAGRESIRMTCKVLR